MTINTERKNGEWILYYFSNNSQYFSIKNGEKCTIALDGNDWIKGKVSNIDDKTFVFTKENNQKITIHCEKVHNIHCQKEIDLIDENRPIKIKNFLKICNEDIRIRIHTNTGVFKRYLNFAGNYTYKEDKLLGRELTKNEIDEILEMTVSKISYVHARGYAGIIICTTNEKGEYQQ